MDWFPKPSRAGLTCYSQFEVRSHLSSESWKHSHTHLHQVEALSGLTTYFRIQRLEPFTNLTQVKV